MPSCKKLKLKNKKRKNVGPSRYPISGPTQKGPTFLFFGREAEMTRVPRCLVIENADKSSHHFLVFFLSLLLLFYYFFLHIIGPVTRLGLRGATKLNINII